MADNRPPIPESVKREVRKACGFGCVICGLPIYDIDHIENYSVVKEHDADNLVLLCPTHHRQKTNGLLAIGRLKKYKQNPINLKVGTTKPFLLDIKSNKMDIYMGGNHFSKDFLSEDDVLYPVVIEDHALLKVKKDGDSLLISLTIYDDNNQLCLLVEDNEIVFSVGLWDARLIGGTLTLENYEKQRLIQIKFNAEKPSLKFVRGDFYFNGHRVKIKKDGELLFIGKNNGSSRGINGVAIGDNPDMSAGFVFMPDPFSTEKKFGVGIMVGKSPTYAKFQVAFGMF